MTETEQKGGFFARIQTMLGGIWSIIIGGIIVIVGLFGSIFAISRIGASRVKKNVEESSTPQSAKSISQETHAEISGKSADEEHPDENTPDWLKSAESPFGSDDVL